MIDLVKVFLTHFTYLALVLVLFAAGMGVPIPEDIPLAFSGYLCHPQESAIRNIPTIDTDNDGKPDLVDPERPVKIPNLYLMMVAGMVGVLAGDTLVFHIGQQGVRGQSFVARHVRKVLNSSRRERLERWFHKHGSLTVFCGRFMPGLRSAVFALAGMSGMKYWRFIIIDGLAAAISVPVFVFIGYHFAATINVLFEQLKHLKQIFLPIGIALAVVALAVYWIRRRAKSVTKPTLP